MTIFAYLFFKKERIKKKCLNNWINSGGDDKFLVVQTSWNSLNLVGQTRRDLFFFLFTFPLCVYVVTWTTTGKNTVAGHPQKKWKKFPHFWVSKVPPQNGNENRCQTILFFFASVFQTHVASRLTRCYLISYGQERKKKMDLGRGID